MDPAFLNYLQNTQQDPQSVGVMNTDRSDSMSPAFLNYLQNSQNEGQLNSKINPAFLKYLQNSEDEEQADNKQFVMPNEETQMVDQQPNARYNPFDLGIRRAIEAARESLGMTDKQQEKAMRRSILSFGNSISQEPVRRGFFNNIGSIAKSLGPALSAYDQDEESYTNNNQALANQILAYQNADEARRNVQEQRLWEREFKDEARRNAQDQNLWEKEFKNDTLAEQRRYHDMQNEQNIARSKGTKKGAHGEDASGLSDLLTMFDHIDKKITDLGDSAYRGRGQTLLDTFLPGGARLNSAESEIETLARTLKGKLFRKWGYRAQAEFKELPSISPYNPPEVNKAIIQQLKDVTLAMEKEDSSGMNNMGKSNLDFTNNQNIPTDIIYNPKNVAKLVNTSLNPNVNTQSDDQWILMRDKATGEERYLLKHELEARPNPSLEEVK